MTDALVTSLSQQIKDAQLSAGDQKELLRALVTENWPKLPASSDLERPLIVEYPKVTVSTGVAMVFKEHGITKTVVVKPGTHYKSPRYQADPNVPFHMLSGGYINLKETPGIGILPANPKKAEDPHVGAIREIEEEIIDDKGQPVFRNIDPARLQVRHIQMITPPSGEANLVIAYKLELSPEEVAIIKAHVARLETDTDYRRAVRAHTKNPDTNEPEICSVAIHPLKEVAEGQHTLLQEGQRILFKKIYEEETRGTVRVCP